MSAIPLGNFTSKANQQAQLQKYKNYLQLQMRLQKDFENANKIAYRDGALPSRPAEIGEFKSAEEETQSVFQQRKLLRENLRKVFKYEKDLLKALDLIPIEEASSFNQVFGIFYPEIEKISNISPEQMLQLWQDYKRKKIREADNLELVGIDDTGRRVELEQLANFLVIQTKRLNISSREKRMIFEEIESALESENDSKLKEISKKIRLGTKISLLQEEEKGEEKVLPYKNELKRVISENLTWGQVKKGGNYDSSRGSKREYAEMIKQMAINMYGLKVEPDVMGKLDEIVARWDKKAGNPLLNRFLEILGQEKKGSGMKRGRKPSNYVVGKGIEAEPEIKWLPFGKYLVDKPALYSTSPKLVVKYPSKARIAEFPSSMITAELARILKTIIEEKRVNFKMVQDLPQKEQTLLYNLVEKAKINNQLGLHGVREEQLEKEAKEFELLRGQVLAGNNSPQLLKNLKTMVMKFMADGRMPKSEGNQILFELQMLI